MNLGRWGITVFLRAWPALNFQKNLAVIAKYGLYVNFALRYDFVKAWISSYSLALWRRERAAVSFFSFMKLYLKAKFTYNLHQFCISGNPRLVHPLLCITLIIAHTFLFLESSNCILAWHGISKSDHLRILPLCAWYLWPIKCNWWWRCTTFIMKALKKNFCVGKFCTSAFFSDREHGGACHIFYKSVPCYIQVLFSYLKAVKVGSR